MLNIFTHGLWNLEAEQIHINVQELNAAELALLSFTKNMQGGHLHLRQDNSTAVLITKMVTAKSPPLLQYLSKCGNMPCREGSPLLQITCLESGTQLPTT